MLNFLPVTPGDRERIHSHLYFAKGHGCEYSFANLLFWGDQKVAWLENCPLIFSTFGKFKSYQLPIGCDRLPDAIAALRQDAGDRGIPFRLFGLTKQETLLLDALYPGQFRFSPVRDSFDYVYDISRLAELKGKKLQAKRNHCNRFAAQYPDYEIIPISLENLPLCEAFAEEWYRAHAHTGEDFEGEKRALTRAFAWFTELKMEGILLKTADGIMGFSMGNRIREDTFDVNFEKALPQVNGAYPMVNREFARRIHAAYPTVQYLNREDDMGLEGLRRAKESYYPDILLEKFVGEEI